MYYRHTNPSALHSQQLLAQALFDLMERKPFHQITVTELCSQAGVGRKTFYRGFELKEDVIQFQLDRMLEDYRRTLSALPGEQMLRHHFTYVREHARYFTALYQNGLSHLAEETFSALMPDTMPLWSEDPREQEYFSAYVSAGAEAIQRLWLRRGCPEEADEVVRLALQAQMGLQPLE